MLSPVHANAQRLVPSPLVISVGHAGRHYAPFAHMLRGAVSDYLLFEDRYADLLPAAVAPEVPRIIALHPRLWIDVNRSESDLDATMLREARPGPLSPRALHGLGLIPRFLPYRQEIWRHPLETADVADRIGNAHRRFHTSVAAALDVARQHHGWALLVDIHSMPPLAGKYAPDVVIGNRANTSAPGWIATAAQRTLQASGLRVALNTPYAGGHVAERHGNPATDVYALQIEFDRSLYLDGSLTRPGRGLARMQDIVGALLHRLALIRYPDAVPVAAE